MALRAYNVNWYIFLPSFLNNLMTISKFSANIASFSTGS